MFQQRPKVRHGWWIAGGLSLSLIILAVRLAVPFYQRAKAREAIFQSGGWVFDEWWLSPRPRPWWHRFAPAGVVSALADVRNILCGPVSDEEGVSMGELLPLLRWFPELKSLDMSGSDIDDSELRAVADLLQLENLSLSNTRFRGSGLTYLARATRLHTLDLSGTDVDD